MLAITASSFSLGLLLRPGPLVPPPALRVRVPPPTACDVKSSPALAPGKPTDVKPSGFARFFSNVGLVAGCLWIVIGLSFLLTAGTNWHATILTEAAMADVDVNNPSVRKLFGT